MKILASIAIAGDVRRPGPPATTELREHLESLYARLDDKQKRMLDR